MVMCLDFCGRLGICSLRFAYVPVKNTLAFCFIARGKTNRAFTLVLGTVPVGTCSRYTHFLVV